MCDLGVRWLAMLSVFFAWPAMAQLREEVIVLTTRPGVQTPYLLSRAPEFKSGVVYVLLSGGSGEHNIGQRGDVIQIFNDQRLLARTRGLFVDHDAVAVLIDVPSDLNRLSDRNRVAAAHITDVQGVLSDLRKRFPAALLVLVGHSNGTVSASHVSAASGTLVDRVVLISGRFVSHWFAGPGLSGFDYAKINVPVLLVHHVQDDCSVTPYSGAAALASRYPLVSVSGPPGLSTASCASFGPHGLEGREVAVVEAIRAWARGQPWPSEIK